MKVSEALSELGVLYEKGVLSKEFENGSDQIESESDHEKSDTGSDEGEVWSVLSDSGDSSGEDDSNLPRGESSRLDSDYELAKQCMDLAEKLQRLAEDGEHGSECVDAVAASGGANSMHLDKNSGDQAESIQEMSEASYDRALKELQVDFVPNLATNISYSWEFQDEVPVSGKRMAALSREIASLKAVLPLAPSASIFIRLDEEKTVLWQALITGPEGTPYADGCFLFDLYFPPTYPAVPPKVKLRTTGGGRMRFNPNLYANGKVCLSLLGTWFGNGSEKWSPFLSTALQVLVSIQALILVPDPFFNEPGHTKGMTSGGALSTRYNQNVQLGTICHSMIEYLKHPPLGFESVVKRHFECKRRKILETIDQWKENAGGNKGREIEAASRELEHLLLNM
ncbi:hypothetical protein BSKO_00867 [Bryopsis sp. KO-2023]|nr:hypothetical protein BSKO_00867 [Bryopsis sp. KO-2023]